MAAISHGAHSGIVWILGLVAVLVLCGTAQWYVPEHTVQPIANRFLCSGPAVVTPASATREADVFSKVECLTRVGRENVTATAFFILTIPVALAVALIGWLVLRIMTPTPKTRIQRAAHT